MLSHCLGILQFCVKKAAAFFSPGELGEATEKNPYIFGKCCSKHVKAAVFIQYLYTAEIEGAG